MKVDIALKVEGKSRFVGGAFLLSWFLYLSLSVTGNHASSESLVAGMDDALSQPIH